LEKGNIIQEKAFNFAIKSIQLYKTMVDQKEFVLSKQLIKSSTSIGANVEEAIAGISKKDFTAKMSIASKEARETLYWLRLFQKSKIVDLNYEEHINDCIELINILTAIVKTSQFKLKQEIIQH
jgi:four helix bundle protein